MNLHSTSSHHPDEEAFYWIYTYWISFTVCSLEKQSEREFGVPVFIASIAVEVKLIDKGIVPDACSAYLHLFEQNTGRVSASDYWCQY